MRERREAGRHAAPESERKRSSGRNTELRRKTPGSRGGGAQMCGCGGVRANKSHRLEGWRKKREGSRGRKGSEKQKSGKRKTLPPGPSRRSMPAARNQ